MTNFDKIRSDGRLLYEYTRGSTAYGLALPTSDVDSGGVFIEPNRWLIGLGNDYAEQVADAKSDNVWYAFKKYMQLLCKSNPTMLESLFVDDEFVRYINPVFDEFVRKNRDVFLTKDVANPYAGYAISQIEKARGLNKKIVNPITERKDVLDFCYTFNKQGSMPMKEWLAKNELKQEYCGLVNVPNMRDTYAVFYDWGNHYEHEGSDAIRSYCAVKKILPIGYRGIVAASDDEHESNEVRLSSIPDKNALPICHMVYNKDAYTCHCRDYKEYQEWVEKRNPVRYAENTNSNFDKKNMAHCVRLLHTGIEILKGEGLQVRRDWDNKFLRDIRAGVYDYDYLIGYAEDKREELNDVKKNSKLPEHINTDVVNEMLINVREGIKM